MSIQEVIASAADRLTPTDRRIAAVVLKEPTLLAFGTVSDLAERAKTSRPSIVRFATRLGFEGYSDLQSWARDGLARRLSSPSHRIRHEAGAPASAQLLESLQAVFSALQGETLDALAKPIAEAPCVWILTGETSMAGARVLQSGLSMVRPGVVLVDEHATGRDLSSAGAGDVAVVLDFARYRRHSVQVARVLNDLGLTVVAITDGPLSPLAALTPTWCQLTIPAVGPFDSSVPVVAAAELIVARVVQLIGEPARARIDRLETLWQATDTFLHYSPRPRRG